MPRHFLLLFLITTWIEISVVQTSKPPNLAIASVNKTLTNSKNLGLRKPLASKQLASNGTRTQENLVTQEKNDLVGSNKVGKKVVKPEQRENPETNLFVAILVCCLFVLVDGITFVVLYKKMLKRKAESGGDIENIASIRSGNDFSKESLDLPMNEAAGDLDLARTIQH